MTSYAFLGSRPSSRARLTACVRLFTPSFESTLLTCRLTVSSVMTSVSAISWLEAPPASR